MTTHKTQDTSREAYAMLNNLGAKQREVYDALEKMGVACNLMVAKWLRWDINRVTPRMNELVKKGLVVEANKGMTDLTGRRVIYWKIADDESLETAKKGQNDSI